MRNPISPSLREFGTVLPREESPCSVWLKRLFRGTERPETFVTVTLNVGLMPFDPVDHVEDPLEAALGRAP